MVVGFEQWKKILGVVNEKEDLSDIIEEIKRCLLACDESKDERKDWRKEDEYKSWKEGDFDVNHQFIINHCDLEHFHGTLLHLASKYGYEKVVKALITAGADINAREETQGQWTALHFATLSDHIAVVRALVEKCADINAKDTQGRTPLDLAVEHNKKEIIDLLVNERYFEQMDVVRVIFKMFTHEKDLNESNIFGKLKEKLRGCIGYEGWEQAGCDIHHPWHMAILLRLAVAVNNIEFVKSLVAEGADVNAKDPNSGTTHLHYATKVVCVGREELVKALIEIGADVNARNTYGYTPLHCAAAACDVCMVRVLIENGADPLLKDYDGKSARTYLECNESNETILKLLEKAEREWLFNKAKKIGGIAGLAVSAVAVGGFVTGMVEVKLMSVIAAVVVVAAVALTAGVVTYNIPSTKIDRPEVNEVEPAKDKQKLGRSFK